MNTFLVGLLGIIALAAFLILAPGIAKVFTHNLAANIGEGTHDSGVITKRATAAMATRHVLVKMGADAQHIAVTAAVTDRPWGICPDEAEAAEDTVRVELLGASPGTKKMVANAAIAANALVTVGAAAGKVATLPVATGSYWIVGTALSAAAADGDVIEVAPCFPILRVVA